MENNQKVGKCGRQVKEGGKVPISICTTLGHINVKPESGLQKDELLVPKNLLSTMEKTEIKKKIDLLEEKATDFRLYRGSYIFEMLNKIVKEQIETDERFGLHDYVASSISNEAKSCICSYCFKTFSKNETKRNIRHATLIQKTLMEIMILTTVHHHAIPMKNQQCRLESPVWLTHALMKLWMK